MPTKLPVPKVYLRGILLFAVLVIVVGAWFLRREKSGARVPGPTNALQILTAYEEQAAKEYWRAELEAQKRLRGVTEIWDAINHSSNKLATAFARLHPEELILAKYEAGTELRHGVRIAAPVGADSVAYSRLMELAEGWVLEQCEFRFVGLNPDTFYVSMHLTHPAKEVRAIVEGNVCVEFTASNSLARVDASKLEVRTRIGPPAFAEMFHAAVPPPAGSYLIDPLIVWDLDSDSQSEVILAAANVVIRRTPDGRWMPDRLLADDPGVVVTAILGDFTGDGAPDFLCARLDGLHLFAGDGTGAFPNAPRVVWSAQPKLRYPQALTAGDIDADGDLDLFLAQYKVPFEKGQMPFPYFEANDGYPSYLFANDGSGNFTDITARAGLAAKRARRAYSASLIDLDRDADLDLILTSDFAGLDAFENNGSGAFTDSTKKWFDETAALGMGHSFADFNLDGVLDLILIGMNSPTADRLASANLSRPYDASDTGRRDAITFGNRLYLGTMEGSQLRFGQRAVSEQVARTGWSWGSAAADFDNDGFPELYIANGHASRASTQDYESEFWLHDIYVGKSQENSLAEAYFRQKLTRARAANHSYGGHERNRFFMNRGGTNFVEVAHLFGVALAEDCRNVAAEDLDGDGRLDLIVTTFEEYPEVRQTVRFYRNKFETVGNYVAVTLADAARAGETGAVVIETESRDGATKESEARVGETRTVETRTNAFAVVSGESYRTQLPLRHHVGVGTNKAVRVEVMNTNFVVRPGLVVREERR